jgi:uncharacterized protein (UPF0218 family)
MTSSQKLYVLPDVLRELLQQPIGILVRDDQELMSVLKDYRFLVSVGDQVTYTLLKHGRPPLMCIVDFIIKRHEYADEMKELIKDFGKECKRIENPPGCITRDLWDMISDAFRGEYHSLSLRVEVDGEEDLAALPAILMAPEDVTIIYGLPDKGVVLVPSNKENKQKVKEILDKM